MISSRTAFAEQLCAFFHPPWMNDDHPRVPWAHCEIQSKDKIIMTLGESWTWGDSLGTNRLQQVWGYRLAKKTGSSWLNVARCGSSNFWIAYQLAELNRWLDDNNSFWPFDSTTIIACWTETGRELSENWSWYRIDPHAVFTSLPRDCTVTETVMSLNNTVINFANEQLEKLRSRINLEFWACHNFCSSKFWRYDWNHADKNWVEILAKHLGIFYDGQPAMTSHRWLDLIKNHLVDSTEKMTEINQLTDEALKVVNFLDASPINYKKASKHPYPEAHCLWAEHLFDCLTTHENQRRN